MQQQAPNLQCRNLVALTGTGRLATIELDQMQSPAGPNPLIEGAEGNCCSLIIRQCGSLCRRITRTLQPLQERCNMARRGGDPASYRTLHTRAKGPRAKGEHIIYLGFCIRPLRIAQCAAALIVWKGASSRYDRPMRAKPAKPA